MFEKIVWIAVAGALGTLARYGLAGFVHSVNGASFPWGTLGVNLVGCLLAGLIWSLFEHRLPVTGEVRTIVIIGFVGAFTTFSAIMLETSELLRSAEWVRAGANVLLQNVLGFAALVAGIALGRLA